MESSTATLTPLGFFYNKFDQSRAWIHKTENGAISIILAAMMVLPLAEIVLRAVFHQGISGSTIIVQNFTLLVGMLGGAIAAREARLLSLSTLTNILPGNWKKAATIFSQGFAAAITIFLCVASVQFVLSERQGNDILAYNIPTWVVELALPLGFASIAWRLVRYGNVTWTSRLLTLAVAGALVAFALFTPISPAKMILPACIALLLATVLGSPVFATLGGLALIFFWGADLPIASIPLDHYRLVTNPTLPTIPLFTLAGYLLAEGGASKRLVRVFMALVGHFRGGPAIVTCLVCAFFTTFTGASGVTILALGGLLMPVLLAARYKERHALGLLTSAGALGMLFPPCLPLILYAIIAKSITIQQIFLGGIVPGVLMVAATAGLGVWLGPKTDKATSPFSWREARQAIWVAKWELLIPVVAFVGLLGGFATPVEASALTALYAFIVETWVYRDLKIFKDVPRVMTECGLLVGGVLLILGVALGFTNYLVDAQVPARAVEWATHSIHSPWMFLLMLNLFLLVVGCLMDIYSAIVVVVPLMVPLGVAFGIDPVHLGIIFLTNLELGFLTPPVGMNLFLSSYRFNKPLSEVYRSVLPMLAVNFIVVLIVTYVPALTTTLPRWFGH
jgi:tripartite ATP-independent transporter DctM subunit